MVEQDDDVHAATIALLPPSDGQDSEGDSGDEDIIEAPSVDNLSGRQLHAEAEATFFRRSGNQSSNGDVAKNEVVTFEPPAKRQKRERDWVQSDIKSTLDDFHFEKQELLISDDPVKYFELFFDEDLCEFLAEMTMKYAKSKGDHEFAVNSVDIKHLLRF